MHGLPCPKPIDMQKHLPHTTGIEDLLDKLAHANWFLKMDFLTGVSRS